MGEILCICYVYLASFSMSEFMLNLNELYPFYFVLILLVWCEMLIAFIIDKMIIAEFINLYFTHSKWVGSDIYHEIEAISSF